MPPLQVRSSSNVVGASSFWGVDSLGGEIQEVEGAVLSTQGREGSLLGSPGQIHPDDHGDEVWGAVSVQTLKEVASLTGPVGGPETKRDGVLVDHTVSVVAAGLRNNKKYSA